MKIAYLNSEYVAALDFESPTCMSDNPLDRIIDGEKNMMSSVLKHPNTEYYSLVDFAKVFNNEEISDMGLIAICEDNKRKLLY